VTGDEATLILRDTIDYPEDRIVRITVWSVPESDAYPDGIKYRLHYGTTAGETILRCDNSHAETKGHERHTADDVETYEYPGDYVTLLDRFREEVEEYERTHK
jgi:hypothetical protein